MRHDIRQGITALTDRKGIHWRASAAPLGIALEPGRPMCRSTKFLVLPLVSGVTVSMAVVAIRAKARGVIRTRPTVTCSVPTGP
jgi:hypothetical protein